MKTKHIETVKIGAKGQIVIPKEVRDMFDIKVGDSLVLLADTEKGIAIQHLDAFDKVAGAIFKHQRERGFPDTSEQYLKFIAALEDEKE